MSLRGFGDDFEGTLSVESATVSWADDDGGVGTAAWDMDNGWLYPRSASGNLRFIDALRSSDELSVTVEAGDAPLIEIRLEGVALLAKPLGPEFHTCLREYADHNG